MCNRKYILHAKIGLHERQLDFVLLLQMECQHCHRTHLCHSLSIAALHTLTWRQSAITVEAQPYKEVLTLAFMSQSRKGYKAQVIYSPPPKCIDNDMEGTSVILHRLCPKFRQTLFGKEPWVGCDNVDSPVCRVYGTVGGLISMT